VFLHVFQHPGGDLQDALEHLRKETGILIRFCETLLFLLSWISILCPTPITESMVGAVCPRILHPQLIEDHPVHSIEYLLKWNDFSVGVTERVFESSKYLP